MARAAIGVARGTARLAPPDAYWRHAERAALERPNARSTPRHNILETTEGRTISPSGSRLPCPCASTLRRHQGQRSGRRLTLQLAHARGARGDKGEERKRNGVPLLLARSVLWPRPLLSPRFPLPHFSPVYSVNLPRWWIGGALCSSNTSFERAGWHGPAPVCFLCHVSFHLPVCGFLKQTLSGAGLWAVRCPCTAPVGSLFPFWSPLFLLCSPSLSAPVFIAFSLSPLPLSLPLLSESAALSPCAGARAIRRGSYQQTLRQASGGRGGARHTAQPGGRQLNLECVPVRPGVLSVCMANGLEVVEAVNILCSPFIQGAPLHHHRHREATKRGRGEESSVVVIPSLLPPPTACLHVRL